MAALFHVNSSLVAGQYLAATATLKSLSCVSILPSRVRNNAPSICL